MRMLKKFGEIRKSMKKITASAARGQTTLWAAMARRVAPSEDGLVVVAMGVCVMTACRRSYG